MSKLGPHLSGSTRTSGDKPSGLEGNPSPWLGCGWGSPSGELALKERAWAFLFTFSHVQQSLWCIPSGHLANVGSLPEKKEGLSREVTEGCEKSQGVGELTQHISLLTNIRLNVCSCRISKCLLLLFGGFQTQNWPHIFEFGKSSMKYFSWFEQYHKFKKN